MKYVASFATIAAASIAAPAAAQEVQADNGGLKAAVIGGFDLISLETATTQERDSDVVYGATVGYDVDTGGAIIGVEAEVTDTTISDSVGDAGLDIYGGIRAGIEVGTGNLVYLKAGYSNVDIDLGDNLEGVRLGAGYEMRAGSLLGRIEYRYTTYNVSDTLGFDVNGNRNQIVVGLGFAF